jgi:Ca2+:H+ antiporter
MASPHARPIPVLSKLDLAIVLGLVTAVVSHATHHVADEAEFRSFWGVFQLIWTFLVTLACAFRAMQRADAIAIRLGEPLGTIVLTLSAIAIEIAMILAVMLTANPIPTVARDTMFAVVMILLGGFTGLALLVGAYREKQHFNFDSSVSYIGLIAALATIGLVLPRFTDSREGGYMWPMTEVFVAFASILVYGAFLWRQTTRDREDFSFRDEANGHGEPRHGAPTVRQVALHAVGLLVTLVTITLLAEGLAEGVEQTIVVLDLPRAFAGVVIAAIILAPEGLAGLSAGLHGQMQRSINVLLGSALSTIGLTIPAVLLLGLFTGKPVELGLEPTEIVILVAVLFVSGLNFSRGRIGFTQGLVHLTLFLGWIAMIFDP